MQVYAPPLPDSHPAKHHLQEVQDRIMDPTASEPGAVRMVINITDAERQALALLIAARGWTNTYAVRRGIHLVIEEALVPSEPP